MTTREHPTVCYKAYVEVCEFTFVNRFWAGLVLHILLRFVAARCTATVRRTVDRFMRRTSCATNTLPRHCNTINDSMLAKTEDRVIYIDTGVLR